MRHETLSEDPDLEQAIADLLPVAQELRVKSSRLLSIKVDRHRDAANSEIAEIYSRIEVRAERIGMNGAALVLILNGVLDARARRGRTAPTGETSRTLLNALTLAQAREADAHRMLSAAQIELRSATEQRVAAQQACEVFGIERVTR